MLGRCASKFCYDFRNDQVNELISVQHSSADYGSGIYMGQGEWPEGDE